MKRERDATKTLGRERKAAFISGVVLVGLGLGFAAAHLVRGYIAYWDIVSGISSNWKVAGIGRSLSF